MRVFIVVFPPFTTLPNRTLQPATSSSSAKPTIPTSCCWQEVVLPMVTNWHHHYPPGLLLEPPVFSASTITNPLQSILHTSANDFLKRQTALVTPLLNILKWLCIALRTKPKILKIFYKVMTWALPSSLFLPHTIYQVALGFLAVLQILHAPYNLHTYCSLWQEYSSYHFAPITSVYLLPLSIHPNPCLLSCILSSCILDKANPVYYLFLYSLQVNNVLIFLSFIFIFFCFSFILLKNFFNDFNNIYFIWAIIYFLFLI